MVITGAQFFRTELKSVRKASADAKLKRFQHKVFSARRKPTLNMRESRVAQPIAHGECDSINIIFCKFLFHSQQKKSFSLEFYINLTHFNDLS